MQYTVSVKNQNDGVQTIVGWFTAKKKAIKFAEDLIETNAKNIEVWNETKKEIITCYNF